MGKYDQCRHGEPEGHCASCAACEACNGECGTCPYAPPASAVPDPTVEAHEVVKALIAELPLDSTGHVTECGYSDKTLSGCDCCGLPSRLAAILAARAAAPDTLRDRLQALCDAAMRNKWHLGTEAVSLTVAQVLAVVGEGA